MINEEPTGIVMYPKTRDGLNEQLEINTDRFVGRVTLDPFVGKEPPQIAALCQSTKLEAVCGQLV